MKKSHENLGDVISVVYSQHALQIFGNFSFECFFRIALILSPFQISDMPCCHALPIFNFPSLSMQQGTTVPFHSTMRFPLHNSWHTDFLPFSLLINFGWKIIRSTNPDHSSLILFTASSVFSKITVDISIFRSLFCRSLS